MGWAQPSCPSGLRPEKIAFLVDDARIEVLFAKRARMGERAFAADAVSLLRPVCPSLRKKL